MIDCGREVDERRFRHSDTQAERLAKHSKWPSGAVLYEVDLQDLDLQRSHEDINQNGAMVDFYASLRRSDGCYHKSLAQLCDIRRVRTSQNASSIHSHKVHALGTKA